MKTLFLLSIGFSAFLILLTNFGENGMGKVRRLTRELTGIEQEIHDLKKENKAMEDEVNLLKHDTFHIEKIAREELGLIREGETVFEFVKK